jgi:hypothetical protein
MANTKTVSAHPALKAARAAWNKIRTTKASAIDKHKIKEEYARCAVRAAEEAIGEKLIPRGRRLHVVRS